MTILVKTTQTADEQQIADFFRDSAGTWRSERRYYTLPEGKTQELVSMIAIHFLPKGDQELLTLAQIHNLPNLDSLSCGAKVSWQSMDLENLEKKVHGQTIFGALGKILYRDRGFATTKPVTAEYAFSHAYTLSLRTEYNGAVFEEEIKLIGDKYRTRQTIISRDGKHLTIGQYLEKRV
ncbi:phycobiliprotein lyase [Cylindrospermopsis curvispora]|uniref:Chromophore lyase CpcS/CpeS n=1 Tax=Cylindrospermopsis curvispora GIHE-G1 TaxID=2666332 RepID=A0A7H0F3Z4_9CYAN|nr:phycobiliprotein lyase [Cylindrospermopsis curvispora]QNP30760.1 phycobiliprotein lyase [Cylindrospermopsis curvispora GIHE-G1]